VPARSVASGKRTGSNPTGIGSSSSRTVAKLRDVVGLYVDPPAHAIVLSVDEKRSHGEWIATDALAE
jgi:hypothetical protein